MTDSASKTAAPAGNPPSFRVRYEQTAGLYCTQFLVSVREEGVVLDCSSGAVFEQGSAAPVVPVHTRLAIPAAAVPRLVQLLTHAARQFGKSNSSAVSGSSSSGESNSVPPGPGARLPKLKGSNV